MTAGQLNGGDLLDPAASPTYLGDWQERVARTAANTQAASERLSAVRATAPDGDGLTEVTVDSAGALLDVRFSERVQRVAPETVARAVMSAARSARRKAAEQSRQIVTETLGGDSLAARAITEQIARVAAADGRD